MPKVTNNTNRPIKVIVAYTIKQYDEDTRREWDISDWHLDSPGGRDADLPFHPSSDAVQWILAPGETQYVECKHTNDCIFTPNVNAPNVWDTTSRPPNWIVGEIDPDEHIHLWYHESWGADQHWEILNNENGQSHYSFQQ